MFDKNIQLSVKTGTQSFDVNSFLLDGTINVENTASTPSPYTHTKVLHVRVCACARYESKPTFIVPSYYQPRFFFVPRATHVGFRVFLDVTQHSQLHIRTFCDSRYTVNELGLTN